MSTSLISLVDTPHAFAVPNEDITATCIKMMGELYVQEEFGVLDEIPQGLDLEQIWGLLQERNGKVMEWANERLEELETAVSTLDDALQQSDSVSEEEEEEEEESSAVEEEVSVQEEEDEEEEEEVAEKDVEQEEDSGEELGVNDEFFSLRDMEKFAEAEEEREEDPDKEEEEEEGDDIDYFEDPDDMMDEDEMEELYYTDFFKQPRQVKKHDGPTRRELQERFKFSGGDKPIDYSHLGGKEEEEEEEDTPMDLLESGSETDEETRTKHEQQQERLKKHIEQLEAENVGNKKWTLAGEASVKSRPMNSLLEENLQFESASKTVPVITQQVTDTLEDIIKKRIMNADYNDVVRKAPPKEKSFKPKEALLNDEKSKLSLAEVYEQEYQQQMHSLPSATTSALEEQHAQVDKMFRDLMYKLDSLTSHNYIPPPMDVEMRTVANVASVRVEEVMPEAVSTGKRLAPHEVHNVLGERVGGDELSKDEKHTLRLRKKRIAKVKGKNKPVETVTTKTK